MAANELIIDDEYCQAMGQYFVDQGENMDKLVNEYIEILEFVREKAITDGEVAKALDAYILCARKMKNRIGVISTITKKHIDDFLTRVDQADQYLF